MQNAFDRGFIFDIYTLVDITPTGVTRHNESDNLQRNQQRNFESLIQTVSLRTQPFDIQRPTSFPLNLTESPIFGDWFTGIQTVWHTSIYVENNDIFKLEDDEFHLLKKDFHQVPVITGLMETARFLLPIFCPYGELKNIIID